MKEEGWNNKSCDCNAEAKEIFQYNDWQGTVKKQELFSGVKKIFNLITKKYKCLGCGQVFLLIGTDIDWNKKEIWCSEEFSE